jgi:Ni/Fe-hydrogenase subunit HybB-like protein
MKVLNWILDHPWRVAGIICMGLGLYATYLRVFYGLGASTNLSDEFPWGLWIGFDLLCGVMLAGGGFTISAIVHVFHVEKWKPIARPAILTAFLGYILVIGGLMFDLGHPFRIWHPLIMWNPHSVMFEIGWCVTLYTTVLFLEFLAFVFERLEWARPAHILHKLTFPLVLASVLLSMLHQSSLGSLFLLVPGRLHELWYTMLLPVLFFVSAIGMGLTMTIVESNLSARAFGRCIEGDLVQGLGRAAAWVLGFYAVLRIGDIIVRGAYTALWPMDRAAAFFLIEIVLGLVIPIIIFSTPKLRANTRLLYRAALLGVLGFIIHRLNVSVTGFEVIAGKTYTPAWTEVAVSLMLVTIGVTAFNLAGRYLPIFETEAEDAERIETWTQERERIDRVRNPKPRLASDRG